MNKPALFLDRDGVINLEKNYVYKIDDFEFVYGIFKLCRIYQDRGFKIVVVTNQAGIARGLYSENDFLKLCEWMTSRFEDHGVVIEKVYYCSHHPEFTGECNCRKPSPGMILQASEDIGINLSKSVLIGDKVTDLEAGLAAGLPSLYWLTKNPFELPEGLSSKISVIGSLIDLVNDENEFVEL